jgi:uncharacterized membrane-anchored protein YhcB (DUF1043 family)
MKIFPETAEEWFAMFKGFVVGFIAGVVVVALAIL